MLSTPGFDATSASASSACGTRTQSSFNEGLVHGFRHQSRIPMKSAPTRRPQSRAAPLDPVPNQMPAIGSLPPQRHDTRRLSLKQHAPEARVIHFSTENVSMHLRDRQRSRIRRNPPESIDHLLNGNIVAFLFKFNMILRRLQSQTAYPDMHQRSSCRGTP